ncbi:MAG: DNA double-strand break repair nuclease NurA, partial [Dehalococcoidia bacterium]
LNLALASYISFPRSTDVVNALRVALCPYDPADCDRYCSGQRPPGGRECDAVAGIQDRDLFERLLGYGQRSPIFISGSRFVHKHYGEHEIHFFYLKLDEEVARVEVPRWVAEREELVELVHALVLDQCRRGHGYPVALMEAHEKAVVTAADRERFWQLVELALAEDRLNIRSSGKRMSKRLRWV